MPCLPITIPLFEGYPRLRSQAPCHVVRFFASVTSGKSSRCWASAGISGMMPLCGAGTWRPALPVSRAAGNGQSCRGPEVLQGGSEVPGWLCGGPQGPGPLARPGPALAQRLLLSLVRELPRWKCRRLHAPSPPNIWSERGTFGQEAVSAVRGKKSDGLIRADLYG
jgi:hypothetical protein